MKRYLHLRALRKCLTMHRSVMMIIDPRGNLPVIYRPAIAITDPKNEAFHDRGIVI